MAWNWLKIRRKMMRGLAWSAGIAVILYGVFTAWVWYLNRPPHYTFRVPPAPSPNALDDFHRAADAISGRNTLGNVEANWYRHALERFHELPSGLRKMPPSPPRSLVPRATLTAFLQQNTEALRLIRVGLTHQYVPPMVTDELDQRYDDHVRDSGKWRNRCREFLEIRALYCMNGNDPHLTAEALIDFIQFQMLTMSWRQLLSIDGMTELRSLATRLSVFEAHAVVARLEDFTHRRRSYAETMEQYRALYLKDLTAFFRDRSSLEWSTDRWRMATAFMTPSATEDHGIWLNLWYAYTIPNASVPAHADRYLTGCIAAARQPCSSHSRFPTPPNDLFNYANFGWDEREKERVEWALQTFKGDALLLTFALEGHRKAHGAYPATLQHLIADGWLAALPLDAFTFKDTICYTRTGTGYRLYSRGPDGKDDGGQTPRPRGWIVGPDSIGDVVFGTTNVAESNSNSGRL